MSTTGRYPQVFSYNDPRLKDLKEGESLSFGGCVPNIGGTQWGSGLAWCKSYMQGFDDKDPEFTLVLGDTCEMCSLNYGCANSAGLGPDCNCNAFAQWYTGSECAVVRGSYAGDPAACCLKSTSTATSGSKTTGFPRADPKDFTWQNIDAPSVVGHNNYTCDPNLLSTCDNNAPTISFYCSRLDDLGTQLAWKPGQPTSSIYPELRNPTGYCSNFVNSMNTMGSKGAAQTVLAGAVNYMANTPGFKDFGATDPNKAKTVSNLLQFCSNMGTCDAQLKAMCHAYTREQVFDAYKKYLELTRANPNDVNAIAYKNIFQACGCHLPPSQYTKWGNIGVTPPCDPICMLPDTIPQFENGVGVQCSQSLCVLDNITVDIINSQTGNINFNTLCGNCTGGNCRCIFSNINVLLSGSSSAGNINFEQSCGGNCSMPDPNNPGNFIQIDCKSGMPSGGSSADSTWTKILKWMRDNKWKTALIIAIIAIVIYLVYKFFQPEKVQHRPVTEKVTLQDLYGDYADYI